LIAQEVVPEAEPLVNKVGLAVTHIDFLTTNPEVEGEPRFTTIGCRGADGARVQILIMRGQIYESPSGARYPSLARDEAYFLTRTFVLACKEGLSVTVNGLVANPDNPEEFFLLAGAQVRVLQSAGGVSPSALREEIESIVELRLTQGGGARVGSPGGGGSRTVPGSGGPSGATPSGDGGGSPGSAGGDSARSAPAPTLEQIVNDLLSDGSFLERLAARLPREEREPAPASQPLPANVSPAEIVELLLANEDFKARFAGDGLPSAGEDSMDAPSNNKFAISASPEVISEVMGCWVGRGSQTPQTRDAEKENPLLPKTTLTLAFPLHPMANFVQLLVIHGTTGEVVFSQNVRVSDPLSLPPGIGEFEAGPVIQSWAGRETSYARVTIPEGDLKSGSSYRVKLRGWKQTDGLTEPPPGAGETTRGQGFGAWGKEKTFRIGRVAYATVGPHSFIKREKNFGESLSDVCRGHEGFFHKATKGGPAEFYADVSFPHGARILEMSMHYYKSRPNPQGMDDEVDEDQRIRLQLLRKTVQFLDVAIEKGTEGEYEDHIFVQMTNPKTGVAEGLIKNAFGAVVETYDLTHPDRKKTWKVLREQAATEISFHEWDPRGSLVELAKLFSSDEDLTENSLDLSGGWKPFEGRDEEEFRKSQGLPTDTALANLVVNNFEYKYLLHLRLPQDSGDNKNTCFSAVRFKYLVP
jgi:hypothetical protein